MTSVPSHSGTRRTGALLILTGLLGGCMSMPDLAEKPTRVSTSPQASVAPVAPAPAQASALSYGTVTSTVQKGKTTQVELVSMFGGPNISTTDAEGTEVWIYERSVTQTDIATQSREYQGAVN